MAEAFFSCPPERVWQVVTDPTQWVWPGGPQWVRGLRDGLHFFTEDDDGLETAFRVTAFAPVRWYGVELESEKVAGRCEALFFRERGGTRVEFTASVEGKTAGRRLLLRLCLGRWQRQYIAEVKRSLEV